MAPQRRPGPHPWAWHPGRHIGRPPIPHRPHAPRHGAMAPLQSPGERAIYWGARAMPGATGPAIRRGHTVMETQANAYVDRVCGTYAARTRPPTGTKIEYLNNKRITFYTFPDGSQARIDRDSKGAVVDANVIG